MTHTCAIKIISWRTTCPDSNQVCVFHSSPEAETEAGMGSKVNSTGLPPALLFRLTTSSVTDTLSPGLTDLGIATLS